MEDFLNPQEALNKLDLTESMLAADFGSGSGGWTLPLAKILEKGRVYAIDILEEPLSALSGKAGAQKLRNITTIRSDVETQQGSTLPNSSVDLVLITNLLFQAEDKKTILEEAKRVLRKGGQILVVDWMPDASLGPKEGRVSAKDLKNLADQLGLSYKKEFTAGSCHWAVVLVK